ncbi:hypothetical protein MPSEU_001025700 [Mayamaea pseudoterrestris]|nr:hypothetical protein MPSEU_001025700 [Mayamaea pseudoterrestris]
MDVYTDENNEEDIRNEYPQWIDDCHLDLGWIQRKLEGSPAFINNAATHSASPASINIKSCSVVVDMSNATRRGARVRDGATLAFSVTLATPPNDIDTEENTGDAQTITNTTTTTTHALMMKQVSDSGLAMSKMLGLSREALFYQGIIAMGSSQDEHFALFEDTIPTVYYAAGDLETGRKVIIMDDLSSRAVDSAVFFAASPEHTALGWKANPNLWKRRHEIITAIQTSASTRNMPSQAMVAKITFQNMARIHAFYWKRPNLLHDKTWLRGNLWMHGRDQESWEAPQNLIRNIYETKVADGSFETAIAWDADLLALTRHAIHGISWEAQQRRLNAETHWTLVHGDFWPGNVLWMNEGDGGAIATSQVRLIDWEMCGIGSGPQDLGQYVISNMEPCERRACERELVQIYFDELVKAGVAGVTWDYCWNEYRIGGVERWLWFLVYFVGLKGFGEWAQFFHDQMAAFVKNHELTMADIVQPRP